MKPIRIFTHVACEPPGYITTLLQQLGMPHEQICLFEGETDGHDLDNVSALVFMGGPGDVNQPTDWMLEELDIIRQADAQGIPMLGICLGAQLMARALGGGVEPNQAIEVGWHPVRCNAAAKAIPGFAELKDAFTVFHWHAHVCVPPAEATVLAASDCTECQAFMLGDHLALQFHLEMEPHTIRELITRYADDLEQTSNCVQPPAQILEAIESKTQQAFAIARTLLTPWLLARKREALGNGVV